MSIITFSLKEILSVKQDMESGKFPMIACSDEFINRLKDLEDEKIDALEAHFNKENREHTRSNVEAALREYPRT